MFWKGQEAARLKHAEYDGITDLPVRITNALPDLPEGSPDLENALITLRNIRWVLLMRRDPAP